jgi:NAD(P)-dependent dehydrogenase (short-subunit alcohol dehydrogenase family)
VSGAAGLVGARAVVTGAASGIGRATALLLLERGASAVAADRDEAGLAVAAKAGAERVNAVCPGLIDTPMNDAVLERIAPLRGGLETGEYARSRMKVVPLGRLADPREVAEVIVFLLSDAASYMTGQSANVTGGMITY